MTSGRTDPGGPAHRTPAELARLVDYLPLRDRFVLSHVTECPFCRGVVQVLLGPLVTDPRLPWDTGDEAERCPIVQRVESLMIELKRSRGEVQRPGAEELASRLLAVPPRQRDGRIQEDAQFHSLPLACVLLERSLLALGEDAETAEHLAFLGMEVAEHVEPDGGPRRAVAGELMARAWALVACVQFRSGERESAGRALDYAGTELRLAGYGKEGPGFHRLLLEMERNENLAAEVFELVERAARMLRESAGRGG